MTDFIFYFSEGWKHIISAEAFDHQLFILALTIIYTLGDWKKLLVLVTAFTIGHSLTLVLSVFDVIRVKTGVVEFLIPVTIVITGVWNLLANKHHKQMNLNYFLALFFGLIHGLGFANSIRMMLASDQSIAVGLAGFNLGLEAGQLVVVACILTLTKLFLDLVKIPQKIYIFAVSLIIIILSSNIAFNRFSSL